MRRARILAGLFAALAASAAAADYLGALLASRDTPVFTTYAAAPARSEYRLDHAYQFMWFDDGRPRVLQRGGRQPRHRLPLP